MLRARVFLGRKFRKHQQADSYLDLSCWWNILLCIRYKIMELICYTVMGVFPALVILSMVSILIYSHPCSLRFGDFLVVMPLILLLLSSRSSQGCVSCCWVVPATVWGWSFLKVMALSHLLMPFGTCLWLWEQPYTTTPSGSTSMPSHPTRFRHPDDSADQWPHILLCLSSFKRSFMWAVSEIRGYLLWEGSAEPRLNVMVNAQDLMVHLDNPLQFTKSNKYRDIRDVSVQMDQNGIPSGG